MDWKRRVLRHIVIAFVGAVVITTVYDRLLFTKFHSSVPHSIAVKALSPAHDLVWNHLDANCYAYPNCYVEELGANVFLYTSGIVIVLIIIDLLPQARRKSSP